MKRLHAFAAASALALLGCEERPAMMYEREIEDLERRLETASEETARPFQLEAIAFRLSGKGDGDQRYVGTPRPLRFADVALADVAELQYGAGRPYVFEFLDEPGRFVVLTPRTRTDVLEAIRTSRMASVIVKVPREPWTPQSGTPLRPDDVQPAGMVALESDWQPSDADIIRGRLATLRHLRVLAERSD